MQTQEMQLGGRASLCVGVAAGTAGMALLVSCGSESEQPQGESQLTLVTSGAGDGSGSHAVIAGEVTFDDGCLLIAGYPAVWPEGTAWDDAKQVVVLPNGESVAVGESVLGGGGYPYVEDIEDELSEREGALLADCAGPTNEVAYFNEGSEVARVTD